VFLASALDVNLAASWKLVDASSCNNEAFTKSCFKVAASAFEAAE
jgi:hypothetical protein